MSACWMFIILMGYRLSHAAQSQSTCACNDQLKTVCVPAGHNVTVPCPELTGDEKTFNLLKNQEVIYNQSCSHENGAPNCKPPYTRVGVQLHDEGNKSVSFRLTGVSANHHGIYKCEGIVIFPPPFIKVQSALRILVLVEGHQCKGNKNCSKPETGGDQNCGFHWIWIPVVLLSIYSIIVSIIALVNWVKLRRTDSQSDYMNTKPRPSRDRKKKRGVQNPILPRHF